MSALSEKDGGLIGGNEGARRNVGSWSGMKSTYRDAVEYRFRPNREMRSLDVVAGTGSSIISGGSTLIMLAALP